MRWISTKNRLATCTLGLVALMLVRSPLAAEEPSIRQLLDSIKPAETPRHGNATPSSYATPTVVNSDPERRTNNTPQASQLWGVPMPATVRTSPAFSPKLWSPDPNASAAYRSIAGSEATSSTVDALRNVRYPQQAPAKPITMRHDRPVDWQASHAPSAAKYFGALQKAKRNSTEPKKETRVGRAQAHVNYGFDLARRGAAHTAEREFVEALWAVSHANDARTGSRRHSDGLRNALKALEEAEEFSPLVRSAESHLEAGRVAAQHKTRMARMVVKQQLDAVSAMQVYLDFAQQNLIQAIAGDGAGADALYGLARSLQAKSQNGSTGSGMAGAKAMALLLAAHTVKPGDHKITNELGVLYARFGELNKAEVMLKRSLVSRERAESWHNLSRVWDMAGKDELAVYAGQRSGQLKDAGATSRANDVRFVAPQEMVAKAPPAPEYTAPVKSQSQVEVASHVSRQQPRGKSPNWFQRALSNGPFPVAKSKEKTMR